MIARGRLALLGLGLLLLLPYLYALRLQDLRVHTLGFEATFWTAFLLYAAAVWLALRLGDLSWRWLAVLFVLAAAMQAILVFTRPTLSDDMYRYVWEGRVQVVSGLSPYRYPPSAPELASLRDPSIWASVNRKPAVTIYPPLAEATDRDGGRGAAVRFVVGGLAARPGTSNRPRVDLSMVPVADL